MLRFINSNQSADINPNAESPKLPALSATNLFFRLFNLLSLHSSFHSFIYPSFHPLTISFFSFLNLLSSILSIGRFPSIHSSLYHPFQHPSFHPTIQSSSQLSMLTSTILSQVILPSFQGLLPILLLRPLLPSLI